jgi:ubiquinone/menaquinone biosynthesis C-methylase UbiE
MEAGHGDVVRQVIGRMRIQAGMQMLDLGCGNGWATRLLGPAAPGAGAVGIDASPQMVARAEELHDWTSRARYEVGTFEALDFPADKFDKVFSMEALYYALDLDQALREALRVLKPGGTADVLIDRFQESPHTESWARTVGVEMAWLAESEWRDRFRAAGFSPVTTERVLDSRGPGDEARFEPDVHCPDWQTRVELHAAGTLWIHAEKPE